MEPRLQTDRDAERKVWTTPELRSLRHAAGARTGSSDYLVETQAGSYLYAPLPS